jgi:hypothetical protein
MFSDNRSAVSAPQFCPGCGRTGPDDARLCPSCGDALAAQGYCDICEVFWPLRPGMSCPKHDVPLESGPNCAPAAFPPGESPRWVTVHTFADPMQAEPPRIRLEAEGIPTFLEGERMGSHTIYQVATGGVKLQVPESLAADARILLGQSWTAPLADDLDDAWEELAPEPGARRRAIMKIVIVFLLVAPLVMTLLSLLFGS